MSKPIAHGSSGFASSHYAGARGSGALPHRDGATPSTRPPYNWQDDAFKCYTLACNLIGERLVRQRIIAALKRKASDE
jgi:hypothetical protein